jgi:hypothetical protein
MDFQFVKQSNNLLPLSSSLRTHSLPMIRLYEPYDEVYYVVRRADGRKLEVPVWMTRPESAQANIVSPARLPVRALLELHRVVVTCLSSSVHNVPEEDYDAAATSKTPTTDVRRSSHHYRCATPIGRARAATPGAGAVGSGARQDDPQGGR